MAGSTKTITTKPIPPCEACRQAIAESEFKQESPIEIYFMGETGQVLKSHSLANLLPLLFDKAVLERFLKKHYSHLLIVTNLSLFYY